MSVAEGFRGTQNTVWQFPGESVQTYDADFTDIPSESAYCNERRLTARLFVPKSRNPSAAAAAAPLSGELGGSSFAMVPFNVVHSVFKLSPPLISLADARQLPPGGSRGGNFRLVPFDWDSPRGGKPGLLHCESGGKCVPIM